jgi:pseudaminic acid synthase
MKKIRIDAHLIGPGQPTFVVAEMSANHNQNFARAKDIINAAKEAGADAVKLQTYTPDTITFDGVQNCFKIEDTIWKGRRLYDLYKKAFTPWDWHPKLKEYADAIGVTLFSAPFDEKAVDFLESIDIPAYKIASFEIVDIPLLRTVAKTQKPVIMSTGMASLGEIEEAVNTLRANGCEELCLLKCTSTYPASPEEMRLKNISHLAETFDLTVGLSDHSLGTAVPIAAVALGASVIEKHFTLSRRDGGEDSVFSMEPEEFRLMVESIRIVEQSVGAVSYELSERETESKKYRRSLFAVENIKKGERFSTHNVRSIRPSSGLHPRFLDEIVSKTARIDIAEGTPLDWHMIG